MPDPSRNLESLILRQIAVVGGKAVAAAIDRDESTVSRIVAGDTGIRLDHLGAFLSVLGLAVVESKGGIVRTIPEEEYQALRTLAGRYFAGGER